MTSTASRLARRIVLTGRVQGLGVRPAVVRWASECGVCGTVRNSSEGLAVEVEGPPDAVLRFRTELTTRLPSGAAVRDQRDEPAEPVGRTSFALTLDGGDGPLAAVVPADLAVCPECIDDVVRSGGARRKGYAFTSCTNCGPRYSILRSMPYERSATSMDDFPPCAACQREMSNVDDRRFHAQTNCCRDCGPRLWCVDRSGRRVAGDREAVPAAVAALREGSVVAVKGLGGYQLLVDATNERAVPRLRARKGRPSKPFAVMVESIDDAERLAFVDETEAAALACAENPIVVLRQRGGTSLAADVTCGLGSVGLMLPTTPLHFLLLRNFGRPLVCTSGNVEGEPLEHDESAAESRLDGIADLWLHHDRPIERPIDDSVVRVVAGRPVTLRLARGLAPLPLDLPTGSPTLALGGHVKSAVALSNGVQSVLGPHIGDLVGLGSRSRFEQEIVGATRLYRTTPHRLVHDRHPDYFTTRHAEQSGQPTFGVPHHHSHVVAGMLEHGWIDQRVLGVAWDGTGFGDDGTIWGGEVLLSAAHRSRRVARLRPLPLPGGDAGIREPWRVALAVLTEAVGPRVAIARMSERVEVRRCERLVELLGKRRFSPLTSSAGRLFDAVAAIVLGTAHADYEAQPAMLLEGVADRSAGGTYPLPLVEGDLVELDWRPLVVDLVTDLEKGCSPATVSMRFHRALAAGIVHVAKRWPSRPVVLTGGVFQNRLLVELVAEAWMDDRPLGLPGVIPPNDGGLAAGQLATALTSDFATGV